MNFSKKRTCKNCVFSLDGCRFGVKVERGVLSADKPIEPCMKVTTDSGEADFYRNGMDSVFKADLEIYRINQKPR